MEKGGQLPPAETREPQRDQKAGGGPTPTTAISSSSQSTPPHPDLSSSPAWDPSPLWISSGSISLHLPPPHIPQDSLRPQAPRKEASGLPPGAATEAPNPQKDSTHRSSHSTTFYQILYILHPAPACPPSLQASAPAAESTCGGRGSQVPDQATLPPGLSKEGWSPRPPHSNLRPNK